MLFDKKLEINCAKAQKSTGPNAAAGNQRSSLNGTRHGLTGQVVVLPAEDLEAFNKFMLEIVESFTPETVMERQLAQSYANYQWRINRAAAIEDNMFTLGIMVDVAGNLQLEHAQVHNAVSNAATFRSDAQEFARLSMFTQRLVNQAERVLKQLKQFQAERRQHQEREMVEAITIYHAHRAAGEFFDPKTLGFALTLSQIEAQIRRRRLTDPVLVVEAAARNCKKAA